MPVKIECEWLEDLGAHIHYLVPKKCVSTDATLAVIHSDNTWTLFDTVFGCQEIFPLGGSSGVERAKEVIERAMKEEGIIDYA